VARCPEVKQNRLLEQELDLRTCAIKNLACRNELRLHLSVMAGSNKSHAALMDMSAFHLSCRIDNIGGIKVAYATKKAALLLAEKMK
jgi:hypothetical protein